MTHEHLVFVFGTLKEGFPNFATNKGRRLPGEYLTQERFPLYLVGERMSPWMIGQPGQGLQVRGQVFAVSDNALAAMDLLERIHAPDGYRRQQIAVLPCDSTTSLPLNVQVYLKPAEQFAVELARKGPLAAYELADAQLYRPRDA